MVSRATPTGAAEQAVKKGVLILKLFLGPKFGRVIQYVLICLLNCRSIPRSLCVIPNRPSQDLAVAFVVGFQGGFKAENGGLEDEAVDELQMLRGIGLRDG